MNLFSFNWVSIQEVALICFSQVLLSRFPVNYQVFSIKDFIMPLFNQNHSGSEEALEKGDEGTE